MISLCNGNLGHREQSVIEAPRRAISAGAIALSGGVGPAVSGGHGGQRDEGIVAQRRDRFQGHVAGSLHRPFVVLLQQDGADQAGDGGLVGEDADNLGAAFDLAVEALERIGNYGDSLLYVPQQLRLPCGVASTRGFGPGLELR